MKYWTKIDYTQYNLLSFILMVNEMCHNEEYGIFIAKPCHEFCECCARSMLFNIVLIPYNP